MPVRLDKSDLASAVKNVVKPTTHSAKPTESVESSGAASSPLSILILGGTGFIGPHQIRRALGRGHKVTIFNRGRHLTAWPAQVEELTGDRAANDYEALSERKFDVCIDNHTSVPHWVRDASAILKGNVGHYIFISTISVYAEALSAGSDESAPRAQYAGEDAMAETPQLMRKNMSLYGPLKALSEDEAHKHFPGITTIIRPGLIVGPGDETDRFTYWLARIARGGKTLVPPLSDPVQFIDVRDLAEWTVRIAERRTLGTFNALGPEFTLTMGGMLSGIRAVTNSAAEFIEASQTFLAAHNINAWSDLPVWIPGRGATAGFHRRRNSRAIAAGLTFRPLADTAVDTLSWFMRQPEERRMRLRAGLATELESDMARLLTE